MFTFNFYTLLCDMAMNVEGRVLEEDTVFYRLFLNVTREKDVTQYLEDQRDIFLAHLGRFCVNYIWQQEKFNLRVHSGTTSTCYFIYFSE